MTCWCLENESGPRRHRKAGEQPCKAGLEAAAKYARDWARRNRESANRTQRQQRARYRQNPEWVEKERGRNRVRNAARAWQPGRPIRLPEDDPL